MSIAHLFSNPVTRQREETGAERKLLLDDLAAEKRRSALLQGKVDELVGQIAKMQRGVIEAAPPATPVPPMIGKAAERYLAALRALGKPSSAREITTSMGMTPPAFYLWWKVHGEAAGIVIHEYRKGQGRPMPLYVIVKKQESAS